MDKKHSKMEIIKTEGVCVMVFIGIIVLLAAVDLCIKKAIEEQEESSFPKELNGTGGRIVHWRRTRVDAA